MFAAAGPAAIIGAHDVDVASEVYRAAPATYGSLRQEPTIAVLAASAAYSFINGRHGVDTRSKLHPDRFVRLMPDAPIGWE